MPKHTRPWSKDFDKDQWSLLTSCSPRRMSSLFFTWLNWVSSDDCVLTRDTCEEGDQGGRHIYDRTRELKEQGEQPKGVGWMEWMTDSTSPLMFFGRKKDENNHMYITITILQELTHQRRVLVYKSERCRFYMSYIGIYWHHCLLGHGTWHICTSTGYAMLPVLIHRYLISCHFNGQPLDDGFQQLPSLQQSWKWTKAPEKTIVLYKQRESVHFRACCRECSTTRFLRGI